MTVDEINNIYYIFIVCFHRAISSNPHTSQGEIEHSVTLLCFYVFFYFHQHEDEKFLIFSERINYSIGNRRKIHKRFYSKGKFAKLWFEIENCWLL